MPHRSSLNILAGAFIVAGLILMLENLKVIEGVSRLWPVVLFIVGGGFLLLFRDRGRRDSVLVWLGVFFLCLGAFFQYLSFAGWDRMATQWPVFLLILAICFAVASRFTRHGMVMVYIATVFTVLFGSLYLVFGVSLSLWPFSLVAFGLSLLSINYADRLVARRPAKDSHDASDNPVH